jgi:hypothetical protein
MKSYHISNICYLQNIYFWLLLFALLFFLPLRETIKRDNKTNNAHKTFERLFICKSNDPTFVPGEPIIKNSKQ